MFLTTKQKGKRIEVKSDLLTKIYNNKIMKNLKTMIDEFQNEAKQRIANGEFEVVEAGYSNSINYLGEIKIMIDDIKFCFSLGKGGYICDLSDVTIYSSPPINEREFSALKKAYYDFTKEDRDSQIKELQSKIDKLKNIS